jgi:hypothetical protein
MTEQKLAQNLLEVTPALLDDKTAVTDVGSIDQRALPKIE